MGEGEIQASIQLRFDPLTADITADLAHNRDKNIGRNNVKFCSSHPTTASSRH
jgi:hypothetical protein